LKKADIAKVLSWLRTYPLWVRWMFAAWVVTTTTVIAILFVVKPTSAVGDTDPKDQSSWNTFFVDQNEVYIVDRLNIGVTVRAEPALSGIDFVVNLYIPRDRNTQVTYDNLYLSKVTKVVYNIESAEFQRVQTEAGKLELKVEAVPQGGGPKPVRVSIRRVG
jgi:hypothetical protein